MGFKASWVFAGLFGVGLTAGCGGDGGGVVTNTTWRLWSDFGVTYSEHTIMGANGDMMNTVECSFDGTTLNFGLVDEGLDEFDQIARRRSVVQVRDASLDGSVCNVQISERPLGVDVGSTPDFTDRCGKGCMLQYTAQDGVVSGTLRCTDVKENAAGTPLELAGSNDPATNSRNPMTFSFENCN